MKLRCECRYCGHRFTEFIYNELGVSALACPQCEDSNLKYVKEENTDPFGYNETRREDAYIKPKK